MSKELKTDEKILRDSIIRKAAVDNMTNIAKQRSDLKQGIVPTNPPVRSATELAEDRTFQASQAIQNLIDLGFDESTAHTIASHMDTDVQVSFNRAYPQIKTDFSSRYNPKVTSPQFFIEYMRNYLKALTASGGVPSNLAYLQDNLITTTADLKKLILNSEYLTRLRDRLIVAGMKPVVQPPDPLNPPDPLAVILNNLIASIPSIDTFSQLDAIAVQDKVLEYQMIQEILDMMRPLPNTPEIEKIMKSKVSSVAQKIITLTDKLGTLNQADLNAIETLTRNTIPNYAGVAQTATQTATQQATFNTAQATAQAITRAQSKIKGDTVFTSPPKFNKSGDSDATELFDDTSLTQTYVYYAGAKTSSNKVLRYIVYILDTDTGEYSVHYGNWSQFEQFLNDMHFNFGRLSDILFNSFIDKSIIQPPNPPFILNQIAVNKYLNDFKQTIKNDKITYIEQNQGLPNSTISGSGLSKQKKPRKKAETKPTKSASGLIPIKLKSGTGLSPIKLKEQIQNEAYNIYNEPLKVEFTPYKSKDREMKPNRKTQKFNVTEGLGIDDNTKYNSKEYRYASFGKFAINMRRLNNGALQVLYLKSLAANPNFPTENISQEFKHYLFELLTNGKSMQSLYKHIPEQEKKTLERLAIYAGVFDKLNIPRINSLEDEKKEMDRFNVLHGEFMAGNDNADIKRELKALLIKFLGENKINKKKGYDYLAQLI